MPAVALYVVLLIAAAVVIGVPVRRLWLDGRSRGTIISYTILLLALALGVTELRPFARYLLPVLGIAYLVPFFTGRLGLDRLLGRRGHAVTVTRAEQQVLPPPRNVTPPPPGTGDAAPRDAGAGDAAGPGSAASSSTEVPPGPGEHR